MDRELNYRDLIKRGFLEYRDACQRTSTSNVETMCAFDDEGGQYLLVRVGWDGKRRLRQIVLHVRLHNGKIWIETDDTEDGFATELLKAGVPKSEIVLAFHPPQLRVLTDFSVA